MQTSWADLLWMLMGEGSYYSVRDLANLSGQPGAIVADVVKSLVQEGFVKKIGSNEPLFTRSSVLLSPGLTVKILLSERDR